MNRPDLVLHVDSRRPAVGIAIETVQCNLLPAGLLLLRDALARDGVEDVSPLAGEALEVPGDVDRGEVGGSEARVCLGFLLLPERIQKFDCGRVVLVSGMMRRGMLSARRGRGAYFACARRAHLLESAACSWGKWPPGQQW